MWRRLLLMLASAALPLAAAESWSGRVVAVSDGDTIRVLRGRATERVRLHGVDCPELGQAFGQRARQRTAELVMGHEVRVAVTERDRFGRYVAEVILPGGESLNRKLVAEGLAWWYREYARRDVELRLLEEKAREARRGLWADAKPVPPWVWRRGRSARK